MPPVEKLSADEVEDTWASGCPIGAQYVPDDLLRRAIAEGRVEWAYSTSSMGSASTHWQHVTTFEGCERWRDEMVAWPPGHVFVAGEDYDDRDVDRVLWRWYFRELRERATRAVPVESHDLVLTEYARVLAALERVWMRGATERDAAIELLLATHVDTVEVDALVAKKQSSIRHLVNGIKARWITRDLGLLYEACITSVERFGHTRPAPLTRDELHHELVQVAVRVARGRPWRSIAW